MTSHLAREGIEAPEWRFVVEPKVDGAEPMTQSPVEVVMIGPLIELIERKAPLSKARIEIELAELGAEIEAL